MEIVVVLLLSLLLPVATQSIGAETLAAEPRATRFVGRVLGPDRAPLAGAVIATSAGGEAVSAADGSFELEARVPTFAECVEVTALAGAGARGLAASVRIAPPGLSSVARVGALVLAPSPVCAASWLPTFGGRPGLDGAARAFAVFDCGNGPELYVGGPFSSAGGVDESRGIVRWDGARWRSVGSGLGPLYGSSVLAFAAFDDGSGPALYAARAFEAGGGVAATNVARWDGASWSVLGGDLDGVVLALTVYDDGGGPRLHAARQLFQFRGWTGRVLRWDGAAWSQIGGTADGEVRALTVFDDGSGPALYAGGSFTNVGNVIAARVARWDGASWSALGTGIAGSSVDALACFDDGGGARLYAGGSFSLAGGAPASHVASWDGASWSALGAGTSAPVRTLAALDDGSGLALHVGGDFTSAGGVAAQRVASWDGAAWTGSSASMDGSVLALASFDAGAGPELYAGGHFFEASGARVRAVARREGADWAPLGRGLDATALTLAVADLGDGAELYAGGHFTFAGAQPAPNVARFDGAAWRPLGAGMNGGVHALAAFDDGGGVALYAAGEFTLAGGAPATRIARWDGDAWSPLGAGLSGGDVFALEVFDDGGGPALYAGGGFTSAGGSPASRVARWDGSSWSALGAGVGGGVVLDLLACDEGGGPVLWVGGSFLTADGAPARRLARWDGAAWTGGFGELTGGRIEALALFDAGGGPALHAAGTFSHAGGPTLNGVAKWDGVAWQPLGSGLDADASALAVFDDGSGPALYAAGRFESAGGVAASRVARWDGAGWSPLGGTLSDEVTSLAVLDAPGGPRLCAGGAFRISPAGDSFVAAFARARRVRGGAR